MSTLTPDRLEAAYQAALAALLRERTPEGHWVGELSTSALSTATAVMALSLVQKHGGPAHDALVDGGLRWLTAHQNPDGGWGDTVRSFSNISTTMLCRSAFHLTGTAEHYAEAVQRAEAWLAERYGPAEKWPEAVRARYGKDRTFATPILTTCALGGLVAWDEVPPLPFELACLPQSWFRFVRLHVVSYALPALIAIGQVIYHHRPPRNPLARAVRAVSRRRSLDVLRKIQPTSGGYLEAIPLTSFVTLSLAACGLAGHDVAKNGVRFLVNAVRPDGSWAIDSDLATWVTTLSINALATARALYRLDRLERVRDWLVKQQFTQPHPYTGADPGGWAWTPLPGGVPDADDTPGALLTLHELKLTPADRYLVSASSHDGKPPPPLWQPIPAGITWLLGLQNRDGGWPTFCRGWGHLPFDRSGADLTAHALRAIARYADAPDRSDRPPLRARMLDAIRSGFAYLARQQRPDGAWLPLWFGNQHAADDENPTYGTARVLAAYRDLDRINDEPARKGVAWLLKNQNADGGWGGGAGTPSSVEETALAVEVLLDAGPAAGPAVDAGLAWLVDQVARGGLDHPTPIGFYFAKLWYYEKLYPIIFTVAALGRARAVRREPARESTPAERGAPAP